ncbi:MAG: beta-phosphoglucomutase [Flammeovirgaceae bacterium]|jgi:beta-phosphoglucomutase
MIEACIFDLDGVIVDTAKHHFLAWRRLANELGFDFTEEDNEQLKGVSRMESLNIILGLGNKTLSNQEKEDWASKKNEWYVAYINEMLTDEILPGSIELLTELRANNIKTALGSASKNAQKILKKLNITHLFDAIIDGTKTTESKPHPQVFLMGAEAIGVNPANCVVFEDAPKGAQAAKAGNMMCVGVGKVENLPEADFVIGSLAETNLADLKNRLMM